MPFALQQVGASEAEIQAAVLASIYHLSLHLKLIMSQFKVTDEVLCQQALGTVNAFVSPALSREPQLSEPESSQSESDLEPDYDYEVSDFAADDALLNQFT